MVKTAKQPAEMHGSQRASESEAYAITVSFELHDGAFETFHRLVSENARESVQAEAGCIRFDVLTPADGVSDVFLYEIYADRAAFDLHLASPHFQLFDERTRDLVRKKSVLAFSVAQNFKNGTTS